MMKLFQKKYIYIRIIPRWKRRKMKVTRRAVTCILSISTKRNVYLTSLQPSSCAAKATQTPSRHDSQP